MRGLFIILFLSLAHLLYGQDFIIKKNGNICVAIASAGSKSFKGSFNAVLAQSMAQLRHGGKILIAKGIYANLDLMVIPFANITIEGEDRSSTILRVKNAADIVLNIFTGFIDVSVPHFCLKNIQLDGNGVNQSKKDNNASLNAKLSGVLSRSANTTLENCYIHDFPQYGYCATWTASNSKIINSKLANSFWNQVTFDENTRNCEVDNCEITGGADVGISAYGSNHIISHCMVHDVSGRHGATGSAWGIGLEVGKIPANGTKILKCRIWGIGMKKGIKITRGAFNCTVSSCYVLDIQTPGAVGIELDETTNCTVANNLIKNILTNGINLDAANNNTVINNAVFNIGPGSSGKNGIAMILQAYGNQTVNNNTINNNYLNGGNIGLKVDEKGLGNKLKGNVLVGLTDNILDNGKNTQKEFNVTGVPSQMIALRKLLIKMN